jgi:hypothetical protein
MWDPTVDLAWRELREDRLAEREGGEPEPPPDLETLLEGEPEEPIPAFAELEKVPEPASQ